MHSAFYEKVLGSVKKTCPPSSCVCEQEEEISNMFSDLHELQWQCARSPGHSKASRQVGLASRVVSKGCEEVWETEWSRPKREARASTMGQINSEPQCAPTGER